MTILRSEGAGESSGDFYGYKIGQSLRFNDNDSAYLHRTVDTTGNRKTWTFSCWLKGASFAGSNVIWATSQQYDTLRYTSTGKFMLLLGNTSANLQTTAVFRDPSAWYNLVLAVDTTQSTSTDRVKFYVNGSQITSFSTSTYPDQNYDTGYNHTSYTNAIGRRQSTSSLYWDSYLAEVNFIDGTALTADSFGETKDGIWIPKSSSGLTFGTNGFYLPFDDSSAIGDDESSNTNDFTVVNLAASDVVPDSPTNNFSTYNPLDRSGTLFSEGNLKVGDVNASAALATAGTMAMRSGKWYFEILRTAGVNGGYWGIIREDQNILDGNHGTSSGDYAYYVQFNGSLLKNAVASASWITAYSTGDIIQVAYDADTGKVWFGRNNTWGGSGDPANGTSEAGTVDSFATYGYKVWTRVIGNASQYEYATLNCGQDSSFAGAKTSGSANAADGNGIGDFYYAPPSGFLALASSNLPEPEIIDGTEHFNTVLYTGNGSTQNITGVGFGSAPDFVWIKERSSSSGHVLHDSVRGAGEYLSSHSTAGEATSTTQVTSFDTDGFTTGASGGSNQSGQTYAAWNWLAGGSASTIAADSISSGVPSIASSVSANTTARFSIVSYTGTESSVTIAHGLGVKPSMIIVKKRTEASPGGARGWAVWHQTLDADKVLRLNSTSKVATEANFFVEGNINSTVFGVNADYDTGWSDNYIAYCFADVDGYLKAGSYTGNGSTSSGSFVYTGFRPAWVMIKCSTSDSTNWLLLDNKREGYNSAQDVLFAESSVDEETNAAKTVDFLSNGFQVAATTNASTNASGGNYIYLAFAEQPFKFANAR